MKCILTLAVILVFAMVSPQVTAQSGGFNVKNVNASNSLTVGTASESVVVLSELVALPPLTNSEIVLLGIPARGSLVYSSDSDVLLVFDGVWWKRVDGQDDSYILAMGSPCPGMPTVTDLDGNTYNTVLIGTQCWMAENLKVTQFPNGDPIRSITDSDTEWVNLLDTNSDVAYCYYDNDGNSEYGALYTYAAAIADNWTKDVDDVTNGEGGQGICPTGWHLPTAAEWKILEGAVDTQYPVGDAEWDKDATRGYDAGTHMKSNMGWNNAGSNGDNSSGFTALPGGYRFYSDGTFISAGDYLFWWSATESSSIGARFRRLDFNSAKVYSSFSFKSYGFSVRCVRD